MATQPAGDNIEPTLFRRLAGKDGRLSAKEIGSSGIAPPPKGYQYTYDFNNPTNPVQLKRDGNSALGKITSVAKVVAPMPRVGLLMTRSSATGSTGFTTRRRYASRSLISARS